LQACCEARLQNSQILRPCRLQPCRVLHCRGRLRSWIHDVLAGMAFSNFSRIYSRVRRYVPDGRATSFYLFGFATWIPAMIFVNSHLLELCWINGRSMYPYLNTDFHRNKKKDLCISWKWKPMEGLQRGMIVTFWCVLSPI
jgi:hypothetical protein